jgi:AcrR family transcriptional regulator
MLHRALLRMLREQPIGAVSVKDLCTEAGINRGTFYLHYGQPQDVLKEIEDAFLDDLSRMLEDNYDQSQVTLTMCRAIDSKRDEWHALWEGDPHLIERAIDLCCDLALAHWNQEGTIPADDGALFLLFITRGASGVVGKWLEEGCRVAPDQMSALIDRFVAEGLRAVSGTQG